MIKIDSKAFKSGNSVAVRLPKQFGVADGEDITIRKIGDTIEITRRDKERITPAELVARLREIGPPPGPTVGRLKPVFPKRRGL